MQKEAVVPLLPFVVDQHHQLGDKNYYTLYCISQMSIYASVGGANPPNMYPWLAGRWNEGHLGTHAPINEVLVGTSCMVYFFVIFIFPQSSLSPFESRQAHSSDSDD